MHIHFSSPSNLRHRLFFFLGFLISLPTFMYYQVKHIIHNNNSTTPRLHPQAYKEYSANEVSLSLH